MNAQLSTNFLSLLMLPIVGAFIGWITNYIAVQMLFHPKKRISLFGFAVQGVFPRRQHEFARKMGELVARELFTVDDVTNRMAALATSEESLHDLAHRIELKAYERLVDQLPYLNYVLKQSHINRLVEYCLPDIRLLILDVSGKLTKRLHRELDVQKIVEEKVAAFSGDKLEEILYSIMKREFREIEIVGALLGFLVGSIQVAIQQFL